MSRFQQRPSAWGRSAVWCLGCLGLLVGGISGAIGDERTRLQIMRRWTLAQAAAAERAEEADQIAARAGTCTLDLKLVNDQGEPVPGLIRVTDLTSGKELRLTGPIARGENWYSIPAQATVRLPRIRLRIEALRGLDTEQSTTELDLREKPTASQQIEFASFYDARARGLFAGNTHLHLMNMTHAEADDYLKLVPRSDNLDLVFLSYLRRVPDDRMYITNEIVKNSFSGGDLQRLSQSGVLFANGEEHRHNFGRYGEGYGHVMFLNLQQLIEPASLGPGIMAEGTDGVPMRRGILQARQQGATILWCHNRFGIEAVPNWLEGLIHAQNIFDGGDHGSYDATFYRYLNLGLKVPFSSGTDWMIYDFSRVYVPLFGKLSSADWLEALRSGHSYITNGPFLELETERGVLGDTLSLESPTTMTVVGRAMGRQPFTAVELIYNGKVVHRVPATREGGYHIADLRHGLRIDEPGWFALRIPPNAGRSELGHPLFAHTSPIYVELGGQRIFRAEVAQDMITQLEQQLPRIEKEGTFANAKERMEIQKLYTKAIDQLRTKLRR
jgi:hypothetical protein